VPHEFVLRAVPVPGAWVGKTLKDLNLRARYQLTVVSIQDPDTPGRDEVPHPERPLSTGVHLVVVGPGDAIDRMRQEGDDASG
jgi:trk system potassium uptake protein TrkA